MVQYFLPKGLGGVYGNVAYAFHERQRQSPDAPGMSGSNDGRYVGARVGYAGGPFDVALSYSQRDVYDWAGSAGTYVGPLDRPGKVKTLNLGATYDFGVVKLFGEYSQSKWDYDSLATDWQSGVWGGVPEDRQKGFLVGVTVPVGAGLIRASYGHVKYETRSPVSLVDLWNTTADPKASKFALGYQHNLSKRTALYATVAHISNKDGANLTVGGPALGSSLLGYGGGTYQARNSTGYEFGLRHSF